MVRRSHLIGPQATAGRLLAVAVLTVGLAGPVTPALAGDNDLVMSRLGRSVATTGGETRAIGDNEMFRSLASELGVALAPRLMSPSDTLGFSGFQFAGDLSFTTISGDADYWCARESSVNDRGECESSGNTLTSIGLFVRKGIWLPLPSFEVGGGLVNLTGSDLFAAQVYAKFALHEGYHDLPLPSVAVRGAASRMMGTSQLDMTVASLDVSVSKLFGIAGSFAIEPYGGWTLLFIVPRSEVLDLTPEVAGDRENNFNFRDQDTILRNRFFAGFKLQYYVFALIFEANIALSGGSEDDQQDTDTPCSEVMTTTLCDSVDRAGAQQSYTLSLGLDF
ncbi:MAG: hypothetical protein AAGC55_01775 [Myxococcota bacterium]